MRAAILAVLASCSVPGKFLIDAQGGGGDATDAATDASPYAPGDYVWIRSMSAMTTFGIADGAAGLVVAADLTAPADVGCATGQLTSNGSTDMAIVGLKDDDASCVYAKSWGNAGSEFPFLDVLDSSGAPLLYGLTGNPSAPYNYDIGQGAKSTSTAVGWIGRYLPTGPVWATTISGNADAKIITSTRGAGSTVYAVGQFAGTQSFNGGVLTSAGNDDLFVARFDTFTGAVALTTQYGGADNEVPTSAAPGPNGGLIFAGMYNGSLSIGGAAPTLTAVSSQNDTFIAAVDSNGVGLWATSIGEVLDDSNPHIAVDGNGDIYVAGTFEGTLVLGSYMFTAQQTTHDIYVAKLSGVDRSVQWAKQISSPGEDNVRGIAVDAHGHVAVGAWVTGTLDGDTPLGGADAVIAEYDATSGNLLWRKIFSTAGDDRAYFMTYGTSGDLYAIVNMGGAYDFGHPIIGPASPASLILRIAP